MFGQINDSIREVVVDLRFVELVKSHKHRRFACLLVMNQIGGIDSVFGFDLVNYCRDDELRFALSLSLRRL